MVGPDLDAWFHSCVRYKTKSNKRANKTNSQIPTAAGWLRAGRGLRGRKRRVKGDWTQGGEHTMKYTHVVSERCTPDMYVMLSINVPPIHLIKYFLNVKTLKNKLHWLSTVLCGKHTHDLIEFLEQL